MSDPFDLTDEPEPAPAARLRRGGDVPSAGLPVAPPSTAYLDGLNPTQREAVEHTEGPLLVLAGAGTGKTRVLTTRIAHILLTRRAWPGQILAVTFTNKAAREMLERVGAAIGQAADGLWLGTFHSIGVRILRRHAELVGLKSNFTILDTDDQVRLIKQLLEAEGVDDKKFPARILSGIIQRWKDRAQGPDQVGTGDDQAEFADGRAVEIYRQYQERLRAVNAADFGDLVMLCVSLFQQHPDVLAEYHRRFRYILVDEYQDTNVAQYLWLRLLAQGARDPQGAIKSGPEARAPSEEPPSPGARASRPLMGGPEVRGPGEGARAPSNICCVGDDDQSIYGWRGAEVGNILRFEKDFPGATIIRLERNYRSTPHILAAASHLIAHNEGRLGKTLWTESKEGDKVRLRGVWDGDEEARVIGEEVEALQREKHALREIAILVRAAFQTREFEERFMTLGVPYRVVGGPRFYERQEIRDALAYLRVVVQPDDDLAFERIYNVPKRGLGDSTLKTLRDIQKTQRVSLFEAARRALETDELRPQARKTLGGLVKNFERWRSMLDGMSHIEVAETLLDESGYTEMWQRDRSPEAPGRLENLKELINALQEFENLQGFLEHVALVTEGNQNAGGDMVTIMTMHAAKGLEFDTVFLPGWEEGLFPNQRALDDKGVSGLEEERRLAYVALTRARKNVHVSFAANRRVFNQWQAAIPSRFISELPEAHLEASSDAGLYGTASMGHYGSMGRGGMMGRTISVAGSGGRGGLSDVDVDADTDASDADWGPDWNRARKLGAGTRPGSTSVYSLGERGGGRFGGGGGGFGGGRRGRFGGEETYDDRRAAGNRPADALAVGQRVFHQKFGYGKIVAIDGNKLDIEFEKAGPKKVLDSFVQAA
ncbi:ATP-dependent helicase [Vineibacter terrae]|uniref:ATP-dependent helicase n=1 Tax=Vineibacter terrae TaxID=2586908 RepID=UPI002E30EDFB|nr:UvrD-helicase domain-containing protein [Vineibacter terrae]HEX2887263.1 UvrD-helicase domain-containing protein [Vineibacter terrae]